MPRNAAVLAAGGGHLLLGSSGHHGVKIVVLVLIVVALAVAFVLLRRSRVRRHRGQPGVAHETPPPTLTATASEATTRTGTWNAGARRNAIEARTLTKRYGDKVAVDQLSFSVEPGQVTGFLGPNGAGKSTTMRLIMGLDRPDGGTVTVNGRPYRDLSWPLREVGALLEAKAIHPGRSAFSHLWMLAKTNHIPRVRVDEVLGLVGLSAVAGQLAGGFSLGMTQRLGIAAALLGDPGIVMFDEPVNGLDTDGIRWVRQLLRQLAAEGRAVFLSSHLMSEMAQTADQLVVIAKGQLVAEMPVREFTTRYARASVRVRSPQVDELRLALERGGASVTEEDGGITVRGLSEDTIGEIAWHHSIMLHELAPRSASLEEAFVESTEKLTEFGGTGPSTSTNGPREDPS